MLKKLSTISAFIVGVIFCGMVAYGSIIVTDRDSSHSEIDMPELNSKGVIVVDMATGYTIYEKNMYEKFYPASTTKIMTATVVMDKGNMDDIVTFSHDAVFSIESGSSAAFVDEGEELTVRQCMYGLMVISANDLANGLAEYISGSNEEFAKLMNKKAAELGCVNTNFTNPHGLHDDNHYTCAYDLAIMGLNAYRNYDFYRELISTQMYEVPPTNKQNETRYWSNTNKLFNKNEKYYYEDCIGGKSGFTDEAGMTLVSYARINGRSIMVVTLGAKGATQVYTDHTTIYDYIKENVSEDYFEQIEAKYNEYKESNVDNTTNISNSDTNNDKNVPASTTATEKSGSNIFLTILKVIGIVVLVVITLIILLYIVLIIRLKIHRMKRRKRMIARKRRYNSELFFNMKDED